MPNTPSQRSTRANSNASSITLSDIKTLIENSKAEILSTVKRENDKLQALVVSLSKRLEELEKKNLNLEAKCESLKEQSANVMDCVVEECDQRRKREKNIVIFGLEEKMDGPLGHRQKHDHEQVVALAEKLNVRNIEMTDIRRLGSSVGKRPLLLRCKDFETKLQMLRESWLLSKLPSYQRVYVKPDLTRLQQSRRRELLSELRARRDRGEDVFLRGNIIVAKDTPQDFH
jgi:hypothetical protein